MNRNRLEELLNLARDAVLYSEQLQDATGELADAATFLEGDVEDAVMEAECATHAAGKAIDRAHGAIGDALCEAELEDAA